MNTLVQDPDFRKRLIVLLVKDRNFLKECSDLISSDDFKPHGRAGREAWMSAVVALNHWEKYREPVEGLLRTEIKDYARKIRLRGQPKRRLLKYVDVILEEKPRAIESIRDKIVSFKKAQLKTEAVEKLIELKERGELTDEKWLEICEQAVDTFSPSSFKSVDYFDTLEARITRRELAYDDTRYPLLFIDPLDSRIKAVGRGHLGLVVAPFKRGKSLFMVHIAKGYTLQALNVLFITLEDPIEDVEDRFDAAITGISVHKLMDMPVTLRRRFSEHKAMTRGRVRIIDGTDGGMTMNTIEEIYLRERNRGFLADVVLIDYDDEVVPAKRHKDRREEFAQIYRDFRQMISKYQLIGWTAAQSRRNTGQKKIISADDIAEDISKVRKATFALSLGQGEWGEDSMYLYVIAHRNDRQYIGWNIMSKKSKMLFYDRDATLKMIMKENSK